MIFGELRPGMLGHLGPPLSLPVGPQKVPPANPHLSLQNRVMDTAVDRCVDIFPDAFVRA